MKANVHASLQYSVPILEHCFGIGQCVFMRASLQRHPGKLGHEQSKEARLSYVLELSDRQTFLSPSRGGRRLIQAQSRDPLSAHRSASVV